MDLHQVVSGMEDLIRRLIGPEIRLLTSMQGDRRRDAGDEWRRPGEGGGTHPARTENPVYLRPPGTAGAGLDPTGVTNLLMKPFTADTLAARIKELITGRTEADGWSV